jgi:hypothetical protein
MLMRHSKQIPMPQSGPRGSPVTDRRNVAIPALATAVATMAPAGTLIRAPLTVIVTASGTGTTRQIGFDRDRGRAAQELIYQ